MKPILFYMAALTLLCACGNDQPETINLERSFIMSDEEGRRAGTVIFRPLGNGEIRDNNNQVIGIITAPAR